MPAHRWPSAPEVPSRHRPSSRRLSLRVTGLVLSAGVLSFAAAALGSVPAVSASTPGPLQGNPLDGADGFTIVTFGDLALGNHELEGSIAAGGNIAVTTQTPFNVIHAASGSSNYTLPTLAGVPVRVVSGGSYDTSAGGMLRVNSAGSAGPATQGRMIFGETGKDSVAPRGAGVCVQASGRTDCQGAVAEQSTFAQTVSETTNPGAFSSLITTAGIASLHDWNEAISAGRVSASSASPTTDSQGLNVTLTAGTPNILTLDASALPQSHWVMRFTGPVPSADTPLIINVRTPDGALVRLPSEAIGMYATGSNANAYAPYMLWNLEQAPGSSALIATDGISPGSILAPNSRLIEPPTVPGTGEQNKGLVEGQIISATATFNNQGELHHYAFQPRLTFTPLTPTATTPAATPTETPPAPAPTETAPVPTETAPAPAPTATTPAATPTETAPMPAPLKTTPASTPRETVPAVAPTESAPAAADRAPTRGPGAKVETGGYLLQNQSTPAYLAPAAAGLAVVLFAVAALMLAISSKRRS